MDIDAFRASLKETEPPAGLDDCLVALWFDRKGDWEAAHARAQEVTSPEGAWVHGYLHRVEGDAANAGYWYRRAGRPFPDITLEEEWAAIAGALLARAG